MNVPSYEFLAFAALVAIAINLSRAVAWRRGVLLVANLAFFASFAHEPRQLVPFTAFLAFGFVAMKLVERFKQRALFILVVLAVLLAFCWLKQYAFIPHGAFLPFVYMAVGMSYVFFRIMHLVIDAFEDALPRSIGLLSYVNYTLNFTCLVAGPIQLYPDYYRTESEEPLPLDWPSIGTGLARIITGFFKVAVAAPFAWYLHDRSIQLLSAGTGEWGRIEYAASIVAIFPIYLYFNFSGYTDFVIGVARFLRLELPENFNKPFAATGFIDFWSRWHITLSGWLKAYVYSPLLLSMMRRFPNRKLEPYFGVGAYFVTFFLVGVWHGQTAMFLFFGFLQGLGVSVNKLYQIVMTQRLGRAGYRDLCANPVYAACSRGLTFTWFAFTLLWFWATGSQLATLATAAGAAGILIALLLVFVTATIAIAALRSLAAYGTGIAIAGRTVLTSDYFQVAWYTVLVTVTVSLTAVLNAPAPHIVYRAF